MFESETKASHYIITFGLDKDRAPIESFILALDANIWNRIEYGKC
jgi:hypothetical protein